MSQLDNLEPKKVFRYFREISQIPRGSRNTRAISDYLVRFARERGLEVYQDEAGNVVIIKEAAAGYEDRDPIILQGHMDMVCEKESGCTIDLEREPLELFVEGDELGARGTTLGGDDGIAVAYALALLDSPELAHPRLEVVLTVDEEIGMLGAARIDLSMLRGHQLLNIDSEREGEFLTSCAGGRSLRIRIPVRRVEMEGQMFTVRVGGLLGGHSGDEIDKERGNADILMGRVLRTLSEAAPFGLLKLLGGGKDNAIPRECTAELLAEEPDVEALSGRLREMDDILRKEYALSDPELYVEFTAGEHARRMATDSASTAKLLFFLRAVPNGVQHMSTAIAGLVETSLNLGILELKEEELSAVISIRSSVSSRKEELSDRVLQLSEMVGGEAEPEGDYPAWEYREDSPLRQRVTSVWKELFGQKPVYTAIHAGLECGILSEKIPELDCVSFGPNIRGIHTPGERLSISSAERVWRFLVEFLR